MIMDCIKTISGTQGKQKTLNNMVSPSKKFGPDEAVMELIDDEISLVSDGKVLIDYAGIETSAVEKGVELSDVKNTISFLITLNPMVVRYCPTNEGVKLLVWVSNYNAFREKYPAISMKDEDAPIPVTGIAKKKEH